MNGCSKNGSTVTPIPAPNRPTITSISPTSGPFSTVVTITGTGFNAISSGDTVKFNNVDAIIQQASTTQLQVSVPMGAGTGPVTVKTGTLITTGSVFTYSYTITVSTFAGNGTPGLINGPAAGAEFNTPEGIICDSKGSIFVADRGNNCLRLITSSGVSTFSGNGNFGHMDGPAIAAEFRQPSSITLDAQGNFYETDVIDALIRKISPNGTVTTIAGTTSGFADGPALTTAQFTFPNTLAVDAQGNIFVADPGNSTIRKITASGKVSTIFGNGVLSTQFSPAGIALDSQGNIYVADENNHCIRKILPSGVESTFAGTRTAGLKDGPVISAQFNKPYGLTIDSKGNLYVTEIGNSTIRKISTDDIVSTIAGNGTQGFMDGPGGQAEFNNPISITQDSIGNFYVSDYVGDRIRKITLQ